MLSTNTKLQLLQHIIDATQSIVLNAAKQTFSALEDGNSEYGGCNHIPEKEIRELISISDLSKCECFTLACLLTTYFKPESFDPLLLKNSSTGKPFTQYGGHIHGSNAVFSPDFQTLYYLYAGNDLKTRMYIQEQINSSCRLVGLNLIQIKSIADHFSESQSIPFATEEMIAKIQGRKYTPGIGNEFPAALLETRMAEEDLILGEETRKKINEIEQWLAYSNIAYEHPELGRKVKKGYRALFYGPSGTGKTLTATILGNKFGLPVYRVDLSMIVSKWVGETEKNLKRLFDIAENKNWILFFDEADAVFSKRSSVNSSNDKHANQEAAYLLQRIEDFSGLIILATNLKMNIDAAFNRRFNNMIYFPAPTEFLREELWKATIPSDYELAEDIDYKHLRKIDLTGGEILNVVHFCVLMAAASENSKVFTVEMLDYAISKELHKKGKT
ncbi:ATP-binding protein [Mangrovivirga sp. M17]|uniref:ATP-binding protein n=1 Tax=Mangrovivirga halotolerans TaxID=2993936 RepID=A0ABT3RN53_9BACT|nr:ATP-binding protein [Mangrovivirga halotolerans]MCX2742687.1 ATP-binding protein [Mangrovivirga halotolerans]